MTQQLVRACLRVLWTQQVVPALLVPQALSCCPAEYWGKTPLDTLDPWVESSALWFAAAAKFSCINHTPYLQSTWPTPPWWSWSAWTTSAASCPPW